jgi:predicted permease
MTRPEGDRGLHGIRRLLRLAPSAARIERDVDDEIDFHLRMHIDELVARGMSPEDARVEAEQRFGDRRDRRTELIAIDRGAVRRRSITEHLDTVRQDLAYALRGMRRSPGFAIMITITLALGLGANAAVFSLVDRLFLRAPAGVIAPDGVSRVYESERQASGELRTSRVFSYPEFRDMRAGAGDSVPMVAYSQLGLKLGPREGAATIQASIVSDGYFAFLGVRPALGRFFSPDETSETGGALAIVLSDHLWRRQFGADSSLVGRTVAIDDQRYAVVGVAPPSFTGVDIDATDAWIPLGARTPMFGGSTRWLTSRNSGWLQVLVRPGADADRAGFITHATNGYRAGRTADGWGKWDPTPTLALGPIIAARGPATGMFNAHEVSIAPRLAAVALVVLLIACANVANLLLARGVERRREIAIRLALGISRARLVRQLLVETLILAVIAGAAAVTVALWAGTALRRMLLPDVQFAGGAIDTRLVVFTAILAVAGAFVTGLVPALRSSRPDVTGALKDGAPQHGGRRARLRNGLLIVQTALSVVLLVGAGLFIRSLREVTHLDLGYDTDRIVMAIAPSTSAGRRPSVRATTDEIVERLAAEPSVERVARAHTPPLYGISYSTLFLPGRDTLPELTRDYPTYLAVSPEFFATVGLRVVSGRGIAGTDRAGAPLVVVVNEAMATQLWSGRSPVGECLMLEAATNPCHTVIGVVENSRRRDVIEDPASQYYLSLPQSSDSAGVASIIVRARDHEAGAAMLAVRTAMDAAFPDDDAGIYSLAGLLDPQLRPWRMGAALFGVLGLLALVVAAVGMYSMLSYSVGQRTREMGVRMALGARGADVVRMIVGEGARVTLVGIAVGVVAALLAGRLVASLLFETSPRDPITLVVVAAVLLAVAIVACLIPARRATRVDPMLALRSE